MRAITHVLLSQLHSFFPLALSEAQLRAVLRMHGYRLSTDLLRRTLAALVKNSQVERAENEGPLRYRLRSMEDYPEETCNG